MNVMECIIQTCSAWGDFYAYQITHMYMYVKLYARHKTQITYGSAIESMGQK